MGIYLESKPWKNVTSWFCRFLLGVFFHVCIFWLYKPFVANALFWVLLASKPHRLLKHGGCCSGHFSVFCFIFWAVLVNKAMDKKALNATLLIFSWKMFQSYPVQVNCSPQQLWAVRNFPSSSIVPHVSVFSKDLFLSLALYEVFLQTEE